MSLVIDLIDLVAKHKSGELRCPATALILMCTVLIVKKKYNTIMDLLYRQATWLILMEVLLVEILWQWCIP